MLSFSKSLVLVVEDDADTRYLYEVALEAAGFEVRAVSTVAEARDVLDTVAPDALVTDFSLADGTAADLVADLAPASRPRAAILVTGYSANSVPAAGFDLVLTKPVTIARLVAELRDRIAA